MIDIDYMMHNSLNIEAFVLYHCALQLDIYGFVVLRSDTKLVRPCSTRRTISIYTKDTVRHLLTVLYLIHIPVHEIASGVIVSKVMGLGG